MLNNAQKCLDTNTLSKQLSENLVLMRTLDKRTQELVRDIDSQADNYISFSNKFSEHKKKYTLDKIQSQFDYAKEYSDDKVQLAIQTYELVIFFFFINAHI